MHGLSEKAFGPTSIDGHSLSVWTDGNGEAMIEALAVSNMAHGVPLATTGRLLLRQCRRGRLKAAGITGEVPDDR